MAFFLSSWDYEQVAWFYSEGMGKGFVQGLAPEYVPDAIGEWAGNRCVVRWGVHG